MSDGIALEPVLRRDRVIVLAAILGVVAICWLYLIVLARGMKSMPGGEMMEIIAWTPTYFALMFLMWSVMMVGMMIPSAAPAILDFAALSRQRQERGEPYVPTLVFVLGYLAVWVAFSLVATLLQWGLNSLALLSPMMVTTSPILGGVLLIAAGVFQWTPIHRNFLSRCRNPLEILKHRFGQGMAAFTMGLENGANCLGCCLVLMLLLFVGGVMNLLWVALISLFVLIEKVVPYGDVCGRWTAVPLVLGGIAVIALHLGFHTNVL